MATLSSRKRPRKGARTPPSKQRAALRKPKGRGHERREEILAAAARMFIERGVESVSTRGIAEAVGISQTSLYVYFPNKSALMDALCDVCFNKLLAMLRSAQLQSGDARERLRKIMRTYVQFGIEHRDEYRLGFMMKQTDRGYGGMDMAQLFDPAMPRTALPVGLQCFFTLQEQVAELAAAGRVRGDPRMVAQVIWASGHGLVTLFITMPDFPWVERAALVEGALDGLLRGFLLEPSTGADAPRSAETNH